ncbi:MAG: hypothetical protein M3O88_02620 [Actinomycetota bacterium]|nr:hypothetical protein [Actinomycetota bacterium]
MFVQIIRAKVKDPAGVRKMWQKAEQELTPGAIGFLGSTGGIADDGTSIAVVRFESEDAARKNSARPEQDAWAREMQQYVEPPIQYVDCTDVTIYGAGGSDDAGFVQIIQARATDRKRLQEMDKQFESTMREQRPDMIGGLSAWHPDGTGWFTSVNYFTSESEARAGERKEMPADMKPIVDEWMSIMQDVEYIDLHDPWMFSP